MIADEGSCLYQTKEDNPILGNHGFNNSIESMRAIFLGSLSIEHFMINSYNFNHILKARGPNFLKNQKISAFKNVDVYPLICNLIRIECNPNNGTLKTFETILNNTNQISSSYFVMSIALFTSIFVLNLKFKYPNFYYY